MSEIEIDDSLASEGNLAKDSIIFGEADSANLQHQQSNEVDPTTEAVRKAILDKQTVALQGWFVENEQEEDERNETKNLNLAQMRQFMLDNPEAVEKAFQDKKLLSKLDIIETEGFKQIRERPEFKNLEWDGPAGEQTRTKEVKNKAGELVTNLTERTINSPTNLRNSNGEEVAIQSYRNIDFPTKLEKDKGPLHLMIAAKDSDGRNMPEDGAVYFTAHYDKSGKLTELSTPTPIKFNGKGDDAIGYIEKEGKIYTLPVTQGKYKEMIKEVSINHGTNIDLSQLVDNDKSVVTDHISTSRPAAEETQSKINTTANAQNAESPKQVKEATSQEQQVSHATKEGDVPAVNLQSEKPREWVRGTVKAKPGTALVGSSRSGESKEIADKVRENLSPPSNSSEKNPNSLRQRSNSLPSLPSQTKQNSMPHGKSGRTI